MADNYIEAYKVDIGGHEIEFAIEELAASDRRKGESPSNRFYAWAGGCGIGRVVTIEEAHRRIVDYIVDRTQRSMDEARDVIERGGRTLARLENKPANLWKFRVEQDNG